MNIVNDEWVINVNLEEIFMKNFMLLNVVGGIVWLTVAGCSASDSGPVEESQLAGKEVSSGTSDIVATVAAPQEGDMNEYFRVVEGKFDQLKEKHAKLTEQVGQKGSDAETPSALDKALEDLTQKGREVQKQIETLKTAKGNEWIALQPDMNRALDELTQSYDAALARFSS
jgi:hypothetical protein